MVGKASDGRLFRCGVCASRGDQCDLGRYPEIAGALLTADKETLLRLADRAPAQTGIHLEAEEISPGRVRFYEVLICRRCQRPRERFPAGFMPTLYAGDVAYV